MWDADAEPLRRSISNTREVEMRVTDRTDVAGPNCARHSLLGNGSRLIDFPQHPQHQRKVRGDGYADVLGETKTRDRYDSADRKRHARVREKRAPR